MHKNKKAREGKTHKQEMEEFEDSQRRQRPETAARFALSRTLEEQRWKPSELPFY